MIRTSPILSGAKYCFVSGDSTQHSDMKVHNENLSDLETRKNIHFLNIFILVSRVNSVFSAS